jgi:hypothetical protein
VRSLRRKKVAELRLTIAQGVFMNIFLPAAILNNKKREKRVFQANKRSEF